MKEKSIIKKSYAFQWLIAIIAIIFLFVISIFYLATSASQKEIEYVRKGNGIVSEHSFQKDGDSLLILIGEIEKDIYVYQDSSGIYTITIPTDRLIDIDCSEKDLIIITWR